MTDQDERVFGGGQGPRAQEGQPATATDERFLMRTVGGPHDANARISPGPWPLPDTLTCSCHPDGLYRKASESQLPPQPPESRVMRGAEFFWEGVA